MQTRSKVGCVQQLSLAVCSRKVRMGVIGSRFPEKISLTNLRKKRVGKRWTEKDFDLSGPEIWKKM
jgi:hypothetical protein